MNLRFRMKECDIIIYINTHTNTHSHTKTTHMPKYTNNYEQREREKQRDITYSNLYLFQLSTAILIYREAIIDYQSMYNFNAFNASSKYYSNISRHLGRVFQ